MHVVFGRGVSRGGRTARGGASKRRAKERACSSLSHSNCCARPAPCQTVTIQEPPGPWLTVADGFMTGGSQAVAVPKRQRP
jgi:hypothetical protein